MNNIKKFALGKPFTVSLMVGYLIASGYLIFASRSLEASIGYGLALIWFILFLAQWSITDVFRRAWAEANDGWASAIKSWSETIVLLEETKERLVMVDRKLHTPEEDEGDEQDRPRRSLT